MKEQAVLQDQVAPEDQVAPPDQAMQYSPGSVQGLVEEGRFCYGHGEYQEALSHLRRAYEMCEAQGEHGQLAEIANDIGVTYTVLEEWKEAEQWLDQASRLFLRVQDFDGQAQAMGNLGSMFRARGKLHQAAMNYQMAADRFRLAGDDERRALTLQALTVVRLRQFRFLLALATYEAALACMPHLTPLQKVLRRIISLPIRMLQG